MYYVWLRYKNVAGDVSSRRFNAVNPILKREDSERDLRRATNGDDIDTLLSWRYIYNMMISADELATVAAGNFMLGFWIGAERWISLETSVTEPIEDELEETPPVWIAVTSPGGTAREFVEGLPSMPEYTLTLTERHNRLNA